jgi:L-lactate dehydrogenase complex protein LldE
MPTVGLFIPCYVEQLYPEVGLATLRLLERHGCRVEYPEQQTCCGQPMTNSGCAAEAKPLADKFLRLFAGYEYVVAPSGSCVSQVRNHYHQFLDGRPGFEHLKRSTYELCEFLVDVLKLPRIEGSFPRKVGLHQSCHALRELRLGSGSERRVPPFNKVQLLLSELRGIQLVELARQDECCGFGGTFAVKFGEISTRLADNKCGHIAASGADAVVLGDLGCMLNIEGRLRRRGDARTRVLHVAEVLAGPE